MTRPRKLWRWLWFALLTLLAVGLVIRAWVIPTLIVRQIEGRYEGRATIRDWWLNSHSAGLVGLVLYEDRSARSPIWVQADQIEADLSLGQVLRGDVMPRRVVVREPRLAFRIDRNGALLTLPRFKSSGPTNAPLPDVVIEDAQLVFRQEDRPEMVVSKVDAELTPEPGGRGGVRITAKADDPIRGHFDASGALGSSFRTGTFELVGKRVAASPSSVTSIPFVSESVWKYVLPTGPVDVRLSIELTGDTQQPARIHTVVGFQHTTVEMPSLGLISLDSVGVLTVNGGVVKLDHIHGRILDGPVVLTGLFDFSRSPSRIDLGVDLERVDVSHTPPGWQLGILDATGRLTGHAHLVVALVDSGPDFTRSWGWGDVAEATLQGIPVSPLRLVMKADEDPSAREGEAPAEPPPATGARPEPRPPQEAAPQAPGGIRLPRRMEAEFAVKDANVNTLVKHLAAHGVKLPEELAGRLSMQAKGVIPLRALSQPHQYVVHGQAVVNEAVAAGLSLGRLATRLDLDEGTLVLTELRGRLADKSKGAAAAATEQEEPVPAEGPLPVGSYRGELRADLAEAGGRLTTTVEAHRLPAGALAELALPKSVSLAGRISATARAEALVASAGDPMSWTAKGRAESDRLAYFRGTEADPVVAESVATSIALEEGRLVLTDLSAKLGEQPLRAQLEVGLASPHPFTARCEAVDANLSDLIALVPGAPAESPVSGALTAQVEAQGTVAPWQFTTHGTGRVDALRAGPVPIGAVPFRWTTADDAILFTPIEARPFGGRIVGQVRVNEMGRGSIEGSAQLTGIDTEQLTKSVPRAGLAFTGKADGRATFTIPASGKPLEARVHLSAPKLTAQGMPAESLRIEMLADRGKLTYDVFADSLGGTVRFQGSAPLDVEPARSIANAKLKVEGFSLAQLWQAVNRTGPLARLDGTGTLDASLHTPLAAFALRATGVAEFQDLHWGGQYPLGHIRGVFAMTPQLWRVEPLTGHLLGGPSQGAIWGDTPAQGPHHLGFDLAVDRASLSQALGMLPTISRHISGFGTLRMAGRFDEALHATAELHVANAKAYGLPLTSLHVPAELTVMEGSGNGTLHLHRWSARLAGGHLTGDGHFRIGEDRAFRAEILLDDLELETLARIETDARRPASGKVSGRIDLTGPNPADLKKLKGKVVLDLDDAAVVELPVFKEIDRFLGAARGGVFEDGDIVGTISNGQLMIDELTLEGRAVQLIGSGTVGFDGQLNLVMVVNTTQIISETGQALVSLIPGLRDGRGRGSARMASYFSNRLLKFRVGGTLRSPSVNLDPSIVVNDAAVNFFGDVFKVPSDMLR